MFLFGTRKEYQRIFERMAAENQLRHDYHAAQLPRIHAEILELLPVLFHTELPGFTGDSLCASPIGIEGFYPSERQRELLHKYFPDAPAIPEEKRGLLARRKAFEFLYLMGSAGTVAFSVGSDMDFWLGMERRRFRLQEQNALQQKIGAIEQWAASAHGMEIHVFTTDIVDLRNDDYGDLGTESCGSAMGVLLKDELYRSMIHLAGKYPKYWFTPAETDDDEYAKLRVERSFLKKTETSLDIGHAYSFHSREIFGAVLWQIVKGFHSPFKSVLKAALLECYAGSETTELLCNRIKRKILSGDRTIRIDPYLELIQHVRRLRQESPDGPQDTRLLEECFLIKCLSGLDANRHGNSLSFLGGIAADWGYSRQEFSHLHSFRDWKIEERKRFATRILRYFLDTYQKLRKKAMDAGNVVSERDLTVMGKVLKAYLQQEPDKVSAHFSLLEPGSIRSVRFVQERNSSGQLQWDLYAGLDGTKTQSEDNRIFQHTSVLHICAWLVRNGYYHNALTVSIPPHPEYPAQFVNEVLRQFSSFFPRERIMVQVLRAWEERARIRRIFLVPNCGIPEPIGLSSLHCITLDTHGEVRILTFQGPKVLESCAAMILHEADLRECDEHFFRVLDYGSTAAARHRTAEAITKALSTLLARAKERLD